MESKPIKNSKLNENGQLEQYPQQTKEVIFQDNCPYCNSDNTEWLREHCIETEEWVCKDCKKHFNIRIERRRYVEKEIFARKCSQCNKVFNEGYCIDGGDRYYCSDECLYKNFTKEEWEEHYTDDGDSYWTEWECEEDFQYYADGTEIEEVEE